MLIQIIENVFLGFAISAAPGAIFFETIRRTLSRKESIIPFQLGNFSGVIIIAMSALAGISILLSDPVISLVFYLVSGLLLVYLGSCSLLSKPTYNSSIEMKKAKYSSFTSGLLLATANPLSIIFWISLTGKFHQQYNSPLLVLTNTLSVIIGALILFIALISTVSYLNKKIDETYLQWFAKASGLIIILYGLLTLSKILSY